jgi:hypothetical protein
MSDKPNSISLHKQTLIPVSRNLTSLPICFVTISSGLSMINSKRLYYYYYYYCYYYSALGTVWAGTRAQSGERYGSGQVLKDNLPLLSQAFRRSHFCRQLPPRPQRRERS